MACVTPVHPHTHGDRALVVVAAVLHRAMQHAPLNTRENACVRAEETCHEARSSCNNDEVIDANTYPYEETTHDDSQSPNSARTVAINTLTPTLTPNRPTLKL